MIDFDYAARQLASVWRLAFTRDWEGGGDWREGFDHSVDDVFKSFWAIAYAAPFALLAFIAGRRFVATRPDADLNALQEAPLAIMLGVNAFAFLLDWGVSIVAIIAVARAVNATRTIAGTIVSYNWATVINTAMQSGVIAMTSIAGEFAVVLSLPVLVMVLFLLWAVFRRAMNASPGIAVAMIILLTLISFITSEIVSSAAGLFLQSSS